MATRPPIIPFAAYGTQRDPRDSLGGALSHAFGSVFLARQEKEDREREKQDREFDQAKKKLEMETLQHRLRGMKLGAKMDALEMATQGALATGERELSRAPQELVEAATKERQFPAPVGPPSELGLPALPKVQIPGVEEFGIQPREASPVEEALTARVSTEREAARAFAERLFQEGQVAEERARIEAKYRKPPSVGTFKPVLDKQTGETVLRTDEQIASDPGRFGPKPEPQKGTELATAAWDKIIAQVPEGQDVPTGEDFLRLIPISERNLVKGIADYTLDPAKVASIRSGERQHIIDMTKQFDPSFDMSQYQARAGFLKELKSSRRGTAGGNIISLETSVKHLADLKKASDELENFPVPILNRIKNVGLAQTTGDPRLASFKTAATGVEGELAAVFKGMGATDQEIRQWRAVFDASNSPAQIRAAIQQAVNLLAGRVEAIQNQYERVMGGPPKEPLLKKSTLKKLGDLGIDVSHLLPESEAFEVGRFKVRVPEASGAVTPRGELYEVGQFKVRVKP